MDKAKMVKKENSEPVVRISGFTKSYRRNQAVRGVDFEVMPGEIYGLIGPDGAGKSTLMKAIAGTLTYDSGMVEVFGVKITSERSAEKIKSRIGFMPQGLGLNLYPELSIEENINFFARLRLVSEKDLKDRKDRLLSMTRLDSFRSRPMKNLSGGMKQKLGLICGLVHEPDLIILDEPTTGVDPVSRRDFWAILADLLLEKGMTALVSTAYMEEAARFHRISLIHEGRVMACGAPDEISALAPGCILTLKATPEMAAFDRLKSVYGHVQTMGESLRVFSGENSHAKAVDELKSSFNGIDIIDIYAQEPELEDVFLQLVNQEKNNSGKTADSDFELSDTVSQPDNAFAIEADGLVRNFSDFRAVDNVTFRVPYGEIFGLLGANGAGKTTVIKMLTGILAPSSGEGHVAGADMRIAGNAIKERIGYMSQAFSLYTDLTVVENIRLYAGIYGLDKKKAEKRIGWIMNMAGLEGYETKQTGGLPMGLRQRLALGCALVHSPRVLFLDEPTSGVDPLGRRRLWETFYRLSREEKVAILVTTHYMSEAEYCDHLALMFAGRIVADSTPGKMKADLEAEAGALLDISSDNPLLSMSLLKDAGFGGIALFGRKIHLIAKDISEAEISIKKILESGGVRLKSISKRALSMEDVFVYRVLELEKKSESIKQE